MIPVSHIHTLATVNFESTKYSWRNQQKIATANC